MSEPRIDDTLPERDDFEQLLADLRPKGSELNRDQLMFLAGRQAALSSSTVSSPSRPRRTGPRWPWPLGTAASWAVTAGVLLAWLGQGPATEINQATPQLAEQTDTHPPEPDGNRDSGPAAGHDERRSDFVLPMAAIAESSWESPHKGREIGQHLVDSLLDGDFRNARRSLLGAHGSQHNTPRAQFNQDVEQSAGDPTAAEPATYASLMRQYLSEDRAHNHKGAPL